MLFKFFYHDALIFGGNIHCTVIATILYVFNFITVIITVAVNRSRAKPSLLHRLHIHKICITHLLLGEPSRVLVP